MPQLGDVFANLDAAKPPRIGDPNWFRVNALSRGNLQCERNVISGNTARNLSVVGILQQLSHPIVISPSQ